MKKILVPTDFSPIALNALHLAVELAIQNDGEIILLHAIQLPVMYDSMLMPALNFEEEYFQELRKSVDSSMKKLKTEIDQEVKVTSHIAYGLPQLAILECAANTKADLIIMGTTGASGIKEFFVGSNTEKIVRTAQIPVIAVKNKVTMKEVHHILFPNILTLNQDALVNQVKNIQACFKAKLHILFVNTPALFQPDEITRKQMIAFVKHFLITNYSLNIFNDVDQESGVIHFSNTTKIDMIAMGTHGRTGLNHLMSGSITEDVVNHVGLPIWTCQQ